MITSADYFKMKARVEKAPVKQIVFTVLGSPKPAGSKRGFPIRRAGGKLGVAIVDACAWSKNWKDVVKKTAMTVQEVGAFFYEPISLELRFSLRRPKHHLNSRGEVRGTAPKYKTTKPDVLKLARAVEDALTGIAWRDDAQIVHEKLSKNYTTLDECVEVHISKVGL